MPSRWCLCLICGWLLAACQNASEQRRSAIVPSRAIAAAANVGLVDIRTAIPDIAVDLRYTSPRNITGRPLYPRNMPCLLRYCTMERLRHAQSILRAQGYSLRIWDAWRPPEVQQQLYNAGAATGMFLDPRVGWSRHCGGIAVDATLVDARGVEQRLPTTHDEDLEHASTHYSGSDPVIRRNLQILHGAMRTAGLEPLSGEWWHFDDRDFINSPIQVVTAWEIGLFR
ncbi:MAG: M15 family metallopeptidase [Prosthecobacter sp.]|nr:M15 family metallopeptidase [Prosthecobacter sp.]